MPAPKLTVSPEPMESGKVTYLPMAPGTAGAKARGRIMLRIDVTNQEAQTITLQSVTCSFPGSGVGSAVRNIGIAINAGTSARWWFAQPADHILFDLPGPATLKLAFTCQGFSQTANFSFPLTPQVSPVPGGALQFPGAAADLSLGEFWSVNGCIHDMGSEGSQTFAYDMGVWGVNHDDGSYSFVGPKGDAKKNGDYRIWSKPIHAVADGSVLEAVNDCPNNPAPLDITSDPAHNSKQFSDQKAAYWGAYEAAHGGADKVHAGSGNHFYLQHGDEVVLYAHMQKGTLNGGLLIPGAHVTKGMQLGLAGNSGNSSAPHLHIHAVKGSKAEEGPLRPMVWSNMWTIDNDLIMGNPQKGVWSPMMNQGIAEGDPLKWDHMDSFLWPAASAPKWPELVQLAVPEADFQGVFDGMAANGFRLDWLDAGTIEPAPGLGVTFFNLIFRPLAGVNYQTSHGLTATEYQAEFDKWVTRNHYRLTHIESYFSHVRGQICHAPIFTSGAGPGTAAYHGKTKAEHQALFDDLTKKGFVPVNISVVPLGSERIYTALYEARNVGGVQAHSTMSVADYQQIFNDNAKQGLTLAYLNSYLFQGEINFVGIWYEKIPSSFASHHMDAGEFQSTLVQERRANLYLRCVTGYQRVFAPNFAAIWSA